MPSIPDIRGPGARGGEDLVRLEAIVLLDKRKVAVKLGGDPPLHHGVRDRRLGALALMVLWRRSFASTHQRSRQFRQLRMRRGRNRVAGAMLSEHGKANALDVRSIKLANGRSIG